MLEVDIRKELASPEGPMMLEFSIREEVSAFIALFGSSGAGKTSVLRMIAGLMQADEGIIRFKGETWYDSAKGISVRPGRRKVGFLFQEYNVFPHMTVRGNLEYASGNDEDRARIPELIEIMQLGELQTKKAGTLSGGQQQRLSLARSLVVNPELLLLDEPLSALHGTMRHRLQEYIYKVHSDYGLTSILASHDPGQNLHLADRALELDHGRIIRDARPKFPENKNSQQLIGEVVETTEDEISVLVGSQLLRIPSDAGRREGLKKGDKVAFPIHAEGSRWIRLL